MKKKILFLSMLFSIQLSFSFNEERISLLLSEYATNIIAYSHNENVEGAYRKLNTLFSTISTNHDNDLFENKVKCQLLTYLRYIGDDYKYNLEVSIDRQKIHPCEKFIEGRNYRFASFSKTTKYNKQTTAVEYLMVIDVTEAEFTIAGLYLKLASIEKKYLADCALDLTSDELKRQQAEMQRFIKSHLQKAQQLYRDKKYPEALNHFKEILQNDANNQTAKDGANQCKNLIAIKDYQTYIEGLVRDKKYNAAEQALKEAKTVNILFDRRWEEKIEEDCKKGNAKLKFDRLLAEADYLLKNHRFKEARNRYEELVRLSPGNSSITGKIEKCKNGDPDYVGKQIEKAYKDAKRSRKYYISTFKTYKKYENTNLLRGTHYDFMTRLLLRKRSKAAKSIGYSRNYAKHLIGKYYLLAKKKGYDNTELRFIIPKEYQNEKR